MQPLSHDRYTDREKEMQTQAETGKLFERDTQGTLAPEGTGRENPVEIQWDRDARVKSNDETPEKYRR